jgi:prolyl 4-hydroxylase
MAALANEATDVHVKYKEATARGAAGHEVDQGHDGIPSYIIPGSKEEANWLKWHPDNKRSKQRSFATGTTNAHYAAQHGDMTTLRKLVDADKSIIHSTDANGWTPLHEGARAGNKEVVKFLFEKGADVNARTNEGTGGSALWWVKKNLGSDNEMVAFLESLGAQEIGPEL